MCWLQAQKTKAMSSSPHISWTLASPSDCDHAHYIPLIWGPPAALGQVSRAQHLTSPSGPCLSALAPATYFARPSPSEHHDSSASTVQAALEPLPSHRFTREVLPQARSGHPGKSRKTLQSTQAVPSACVLSERGQEGAEQEDGWFCRS